LKKISLKIKKGEIVSIIGGTGQGKTTLALCFNGLIPRMIPGDFSGSVVVDGLDTKENDVHKMATKVGLVFQDPDDQIFSLDVKEEIAFGLKNMGLSEKQVEKRVREAVKTVEIQDLVDRETNELSEGQKQKVCIAAVLAMDPEVIVLDEPTAELDYKSSKEIFEIVKNLSQKGKTVIVIEHKSDFLLEYSTRVLVLETGRIVLDDHPRRVFCKTSFLDELGIEVPAFCRLNSELKKKGMDVSFSTLTEAVDELTGKWKGVKKDKARKTRWKK
jgi:energy-coupling factor transporter ATP-binding protein EcfA2